MQRSLPLAAFLSFTVRSPRRTVAQTSPSAEQIRQQDAHSEAEWYYSVGIQNYVFALPLTIMERERKIRLDPIALERGKESRARRADQPDRPHARARHRRRHHALHAQQRHGLQRRLPRTRRRSGHPERARHRRPLLVRRGRRRLHQQPVLHRHPRHRRQRRQPRFRGAELARHAAEGRDRPSFSHQHRHVRHSHRRPPAGPGRSAKGQRAAGKIPSDIARRTGATPRNSARSRAPSSARVRTTAAISPGSRQPPICSPKTRRHPIRKPPSSCSAAAASRSASRWMSAALDEAAHDGLARAAAIAPQIMKWKVKYPRHAVPDALEQSAPRRLRRRLFRPRRRRPGGPVRA